MHITHMHAHTHTCTHTQQVELPSVSAIAAAAGKRGRASPHMHIIQGITATNALFLHRDSLTHVNMSVQVGGGAFSRSVWGWVHQCECVADAIYTVISLNYYTGVCVIHSTN